MQSNINADAKMHFPKKETQIRKKTDEIKEIKSKIFLDVCREIFRRKSAKC